MFALGEAEMSGRVLDCSAGASSFVAEVAPRAELAIAVDPAYSMSRAELAELGKADLERGSAIAHAHPERFTWNWYGAPERRTQLRNTALARFLVDLAMAPQRYVAGALPQLPFRDRSFDLAICSHLLFTWGDQLGHTWHLAALRELIRVANEVRVFPTVMQGPGEPVPFWDALMSDLVSDGIRVGLRTVDYEFQVGADNMLVMAR